MFRAQREGGAPPAAKVGVPTPSGPPRRPRSTRARVEGTLGSPVGSPRPRPPNEEGIWSASRNREVETEDSRD